ncbi:MAG: hypothetical protein CO066_13460 [Comamonadaceae bacterium CG_4_9_14_0_8_um_filter_60_18]|nr:MAG: hypothetical protein CO066_13460 [Comamonadaceae bacterium CG_4_9_14_0_8_um_filter_60_18]
MKLSKQQIDVLAASLAHPYGNGVTLLCDDYMVTLKVEAAEAMNYRVMTYVNGHFKGIWCGLAKQDCPEQKFLRKMVRPRCSPAKKRVMEKVMGKRYVKNKPYYSEQWISYWPDWVSGKAALNHLNRVCESVELVE